MHLYSKPMKTRLSKDAAKRFGFYERVARWQPLSKDSLRNLFSLLQATFMIKLPPNWTAKPHHKKLWLEHTTGHAQTKSIWESRYLQKSENTALVFFHSIILCTFVSFIRKKKPHWSFWLQHEWRCENVQQERLVLQGTVNIFETLCS